jgi:uncharacterized protein with FMN-binding domain
MRRKTKAIIVSTLTGSVMIVGSRFALASSDQGEHGRTDLAARPAQCGTGDDRDGRSRSGPATRSREGGEDGGDGRERCRPGTRPPHGGRSAVPSPVTTGSRPPAPSPSATRVASSAPPAPSPSATTSAAPACTSYTGSAASPVPPGNGTVTVTVKVCGGVVTAATAVQVDNSGYGPNAQAIPALNTLAVQYYKTDITKIHYSGATLTSNAYQTSLTSALTKAGI